MLKIGNINKLKVNRKTDIGYVLDAPEGEVFYTIMNPYIWI